MYNLDLILNTIVKQGLREDNVNKRGIQFMVRHKAHFMNDKVKGFVSGSFASLKLNANSCTHWTPNLFANGTYTSSERKYIKGYTEENLRQINTFVAEIDTKDFTVGEIVLECVDNGLGEPTLILESDRGYHVYFVLDAPVYVTAKSNYKSLKVAKRISNNIKRSLSGIGVDMDCNDFVFFRTPNNSNIRFFSEHNTKSFSSLINWSYQYDDSIGRSFKLIQGGLSKSTQSTDWIFGLLNNPKIKGERGQIGRNNLIFTLALSCFQDGKDESQCFDILDEYNSKLDLPLQSKSLRTIAASAYSGRYKGASEDYISNLYQTYSDKKYTRKTNSNNWYKFKKARVDRKRSHYDEWENDINKYLNNNVRSAGFLTMSQKELCDKIGISRSTLNELMKNSRILMKSTIGVGRNAVTRWTTISIMYNYAIQRLQTVKDNYTSFLQSFISDILDTIESNPALISLTHYVCLLIDGRSNGEDISILI